MKMLMVIVLVMVGGVIHADSVFARGGSSGAGAAAGSGAGAASGAAGPAADGEGAPGDAAPGAAADGSTAETGPGDRLGGPPAGFANDPSIYRSPVTAWPGQIEYPSASPRDPAVVAPPAVLGGPPVVIVTPQPPVIVRAPGRIDLLPTPLMCPGINASDARKC